MTHDSEAPHESLPISVRPITKGREVYISYLTPESDTVGVVRRAMLKACYGFDCKCATCSLEGLEAQLSDMRRTLIAGLTNKLAGLDPPIWRWTAQFGTRGPESQSRHSSSPLTYSDRTLYSFLVARLLEAEGLKSVSVTNNYAMAATFLHLQMSEVKHMIIIPAMRNWVDWMERAEENMIEVRHEDFSESVVMSQLIADTRRKGDVRISKEFVSMVRLSGKGVC